MFGAAMAPSPENNKIDEQKKDYFSMDLSRLLTSAGINIGICALFLSLYSVFRKQPGNVYVYFGRRLSQEDGERRNINALERLVPSASWIVKAWQITEDELLSFAGVDAVVFLRVLVFSIRIFSIAMVVCIFGVLPVNYFGEVKKHMAIPPEALFVFTIANVKDKSQWLWVHCVALYIITLSACILLYFEYKSISGMRLAHITQSPPNPSHFSVLVRSIPRSSDESLDDAIKNFFTNYHGLSYLSHRTIHRTGKVHKFMSTAEKVYKKFVRLKVAQFDHKCRPNIYRCGLCGGTSNSFQLYHNDFELDAKKKGHDHSETTDEKKECSAAFVFFKTRYAAVVASQVLQSSNPMLWVTDQAPEPHDVYWPNLWIPYRQLWIRRITILVASIFLMIMLVPPITFLQGLTQLEELKEKLPFVKIIIKRNILMRLVSGYLPSVLLQLLIYTVPPVMMLFSAVEGPISRSGRKKSACCKVLYFTIWTVFFVNVISGTVLNKLDAISTPKDIPSLLAKAVPEQSTFFMTHVLTSGWASLSSEIMQTFALIYNFVGKRMFGLQDDPDSVPSFPYHTEVPRLLAFGLLGFTCSILAPLILPFLLVYFFLGYVVYRNQIMNVYCSKYESGGQMWPIVHNTAIFSLVLTQIIALGVFGMKRYPVASGFTIPLVIATILFNEYCRQRFYPMFNNISAQDLIQMDRDDEQSDRMEEIHQLLLTAYCQSAPPASSQDTCDDDGSSINEANRTDFSQEIIDSITPHQTWDCRT
ncbi:CSC1-like protein RXW8 [Phoenix dactylifera]|uniref:CSC1-like protein RXW8 n=1 Tax=Phoenix dactylifera TaxID=42345 RepID=A0A8B7C2I1_PHODC|nr:CSC1-like protein RXW8 [Phoenix dactylifera]